MTGRAAVALAFGCLALPAGASRPCEALAALAGAARIESRDTVVVYRTMPARIEVGQRFAVEAAVCAKAAPDPSGIRVDAQMPAHRHGMNYRARVSPRGEGRYLAEGLLFHMPGRWQLVFDVERPARVERLTHEVDVE